MHNFVFGIFPYIALTVLAVGSIARYERDPFTWKSSSSQLLRTRQFVIGSVLFHVGIITIFFGHLFGLLTPIWVFDLLGVSKPVKQTMAVAVGGVAGLAALAGGLILLHRRLLDPRIRATSTLADTGILVLLMLQLVLGLLTIVVSLRHLDGHEMAKFMAWAQGIFTFKPNAAAYIVDVNPLFKAHIFLGLVIFLVFPFTRLVHMLSAPVRYLWRPGYQIVRSRRQAPVIQSAPMKTRPARPAAEPITVGAPGAAVRPAE